MADFLEEKRREIQARLKELKPLVDEYHRLEAAEQALAGVGSTPAPRRHRARKPRATRHAATAPRRGRRGRPKGSGQRAQQALELVRAKPGITIPEMAEAMGIKQNYLYRVVPDLDKEGLVTKSGRGWHVRTDAAARPLADQAQLLDGVALPLSSLTVMSILRLGELADLEALDDLVARRRSMRTGREH